MDTKQVFEILMRENSAMLLTYIRAVAGSANAVDDLFQETMITAWTKLDEFDRSNAFGPWLRGIAKNHACNHYRKNKRDMLMCNSKIFEYLDAQLNHIEAHQGDTWQEKTRDLRQCIEELPDIYQQVIRFRYLDELKTNEVNKRIGVPKETLKKRLQRAKKNLRQCLQVKGAVLPSVES